MTTTQGRVLPPDEPLFPRGDFLLPSGAVHLCAAGEAPTLMSHIMAFAEYARDKSDGAAGPARSRQEARVLSARERLGRLMSVPAEDVGLVSNVAEGMSIVLESVSWRAGDNVCALSYEFPSVALPLRFLDERQVELRLARDPAELVELINERTQVVAVSYVSYWSAERIDIGPVREACDRTGTWLVVDYSHAAGVLPVNATIADFAFSACYKWMLGVTGVAAAIWNQERLAGWAPRSAGWYSVQMPGVPDYSELPAPKSGGARFSRGNVAYPSVYALDNALAYLAMFGVDAVAAHAKELTTMLLEHLPEGPWQCVTPRDELARGTSVCLVTDDVAGLVGHLRQEGIHGWGGRGRVRLSLHGYNSSGDVARVIECLGGR